MCRHSFYKHERIKSFLCRSTCKDFEKFFQFLASTDILGGPYIVFTGKEVVDEIFVGFDKLLQFHSRKWCVSFIFLYVSSNANWSVHEMGTRFGIWEI